MAGNCKKTEYLLKYFRTFFPKPLDSQNDLVYNINVVVKKTTKLHEREEIDHVDRKTLSFHRCKKQNHYTLPNQGAARRKSYDPPQQRQVPHGLFRRGIRELRKQDQRDLEDQS